MIENRKIPLPISKYKHGEKSMSIFGKAKDWVASRFAERTSWDGVSLVVVCGSVILLGGLAKWLAWAGLVYGVYTLVKSED